MWEKALVVGCKVKAGEECKKSRQLNATGFFYSYISFII